MKKKWSKLGFVLIALAALFSAVSCGRGKAAVGASGEATAAEAEYALLDGGAVYGSYAVMDAAAPASMVVNSKSAAPARASSANSSLESRSGGTEALVRNIRDLNLKLIYRANLSVQTLDYDGTYNTLTSLVNECGGYFESAYKYNGGMNSQGGHPYGNYTIRIPSEKYADFVDKIGRSTHLVDLSQSVEDVSEAYSDIEARLETLNTKHERLISLLSSAKDMKDIIQLENALSETESELDRYSARKRNYDSLVGFSTIHLSLEEVERFSPAVPEKPLTFAQKIGRAVKRGFERAVDSVANIILWLTGHIVGIVFWAVVIFVAISFFRRRRAKREAEKREQL